MKNSLKITLPAPRTDWPAVLPVLIAAALIAAVLLLILPHAGGGEDETAADTGSETAESLTLTDSADGGGTLMRRHAPKTRGAVGGQTAGRGGAGTG